MKIYISGINYKNTPIEVREKLSFSDEKEKQAIMQIYSMEGICECIMLSTCNRTEVYIYAEEGFDRQKIEECLCSLKELDVSVYRKYFYYYAEDKAVRHLYKVAAGLDSMILGEDQILNQVKFSYELSHKMGTSSSILNTLFREAITTAKKIKTDTALSKASLSVGSQAVKMAEAFFENGLKDKKALVIGTGKIGMITLKNLCQKGLDKIYITNRTHNKAKMYLELYERMELIEYADRYRVIDNCDIVISCTSSPHYTVTSDMLKEYLKGFKKRIYIDLAVPRDMDSKVSAIPGIRYFDIDHLKSAVDENLEKRIFEAAKAEDIIEEAVKDFGKWYGFRSVLPIIKEVQKFSENILENRINQTFARLKDASEEEKDIVKQNMTITVNELLNKFVYSIRDLDNLEDTQAYFRCLQKVFKN